VSGKCTGWVIEHGPRNIYEFAVLMVIADAANADGEHAHPGMVNLVRGSRLASDRGVQKVLKRLLEDEWIEVTEEGGGRGRATVYRVLMGRGKPRTRDGVSARANPEPDAGITAGNPEPGDSETPNESDGNPEPGRNRSSYATEKPTVESNAVPAASGVDVGADIERLCTLLADLIEANGSKRPTITAKWRLECDRLMRLDGRTAEQIERAIRWSQRDAFWRANVLSMPTLREKYDQLRLAALRSTEMGGPTRRPVGLDAVESYATQRGLLEPR
jgi:hypothetical protein